MTWELTVVYHGLGLTGSLEITALPGALAEKGKQAERRCQKARPPPWTPHKSSYCLRCILWMMSRQSLNTLRMFSVSTAQVKCGQQQCLPSPVAVLILCKKKEAWCSGALATSPKGTWNAVPTPFILDQRVEDLGVVCLTWKYRTVGSV